MSEQAYAAEPRHRRRERCDHICLLEKDHPLEGGHFHGYEGPSPRRYDRMRELCFGRLVIGWLPARDAALGLTEEGH